MRTAIDPTLLTRFSTRSAAERYNINRAEEATTVVVEPALALASEPRREGPRSGNDVIAEPEFAAPGIQSVSSSNELIATEPCTYFDPRAYSWAPSVPTGAGEPATIAENALAPEIAPTGSDAEAVAPFQFSETPSENTAGLATADAPRVSYNPGGFSGALKISSDGSATVGTGILPSVPNDSMLELAGSVSALQDGTTDIGSLSPYVPPDRSSPLRVAVTANLYLFGLNNVMRDHPQPFSGGRSASQVVLDNSLQEGAIRMWDDQATSPNPPGIELPDGTANPSLVFYNKAERDALVSFEQMRDQNKLDVLIGAPDSNSAATQLAALSASGQSIGLLYVHGHGASGDLSVGPNWKFGEGLSATIDSDNGRATVAGLSMFDGIKWAPGATIVLAGCDVGEGEKGQALVWAISQYTGQRVVAWKEHSQMGPSGPYGIGEGLQRINEPDVDSNHMVDGRTIKE